MNADVIAELIRLAWDHLLPSIPDDQIELAILLNILSTDDLDEAQIIRLVELLVAARVI